MTKQQSATWEVAFWYWNHWGFEGLRLHTTVTVAVKSQQTGPMYLTGKMPPGGAELKWCYHAVRSILRNHLNKNNNATWSSICKRCLT